MNDLAATPVNSTLYMFADDTKDLMMVKEVEDSVKLQLDLDGFMETQFQGAKMYSNELL